MNKKDKQIVKDLADILGRLSKYFEQMADDNIEKNVLETNYHDFYILDKYLGWNIKKALVFKRDIKEFKKDMEKSYIIHYDKFGKCGAQSSSNICYHNYFRELQAKRLTKMNELIEKIKTLTPIEVIERTRDYAEIKLPQYDKDETYCLHKSDDYLYRALRKNAQYNNKIKTLNGLISLRTDMREIINHMLGELAESYIDFNIKEGLYDTDPYSENRLSIYELELLERVMNERDEIRGYKPYYLFTYSDERITFDNVDKIIDEMIKKEIIIVKE